MSAEPITWGWDAVCIMDADKITHLYKELYESEREHGVVKNIGFDNYIAQDDGETKVTLSLKSTVGPPLISFPEHKKDLATLVMPFLRAVYVKETLYMDDGDVVFNSTVIIEYSDNELTKTTIRTPRSGKPIIKRKHYTVVGDVSVNGLMTLSKLTGSVDGEHHVVRTFNS